mmetsp:Transcript_41402/g.89763  ORF Transcript_41402/g.89763 Transcript_41402/m.89763 type:complete len:358 (-) Transcript_41402:153-1226(-)
MARRSSSLLTFAVGSDTLSGALAFFLKLQQRALKENRSRDLPYAFDGKDEVILRLHQHHAFLLAIEGFQALSAGGTISLVHHHRTLALWHILHIKDAHGTTPLELLSILVQDLLLQANHWMQPVESSAHWRPFGMLLANALLTCAHTLNLLTWCQLCQKYLIVHRRRRSRLQSFFLLLREWEPSKIFRIDGQLLLSLRALRLENEGDAILLREIRLVVLSALQEVWLKLDGNQAQPVRQVFIVNHRGVLIDGHSTDRHRGHLCNEDAPERIHQGRVNAKHVKHHLLITEFFDVNFEAFLKGFQVPGVVQAQGCKGTTEVLAVDVAGTLCGETQDVLLLMGASRGCAKSLWLRLWLRL